MTIRDRLKAQMFKARAVALGFWLLCASGLIIHNSAYVKFIFVPFLGFAGSVFYILFFIKCPKCGAPLGQAMSSISKPNFCPSCGVNFDTSEA